MPESSDDLRQASDEVYRGEIAPRRLAVAMILSLAMPGLGHVYCGHLRRGLTVSSLVVAGAATFCAVAWGANVFLPRAFLMACVGWVALQISLVRGLRRWTGAPGADYVLRTHNHPLVYVGLLLALEILPAVFAVSLISERVLVDLTVSDRNGFPKLLVGDRVYGTRLAFDQGPPERGELVMVGGEGRAPSVLRVVAVPGDEVAMEGGTLVVNGVPRYQQPLGQLEVDGVDPPPAYVEGIRAYREFAEGGAYEVYVPDGVAPEDLSPLELGEDEFFLLADLRGVERVLDSRRLGPVAARDILGKPLYVWWSADDGTGRVRWHRIGIEVL